MKTIILGAVAAALLHITPTVVLVKRQDAVNRLLPGADQFAARELHLSSADSKRLHDAVGWEPPDGVVTFYVGKHQDQASGALIFMRVDCQHGPLELAIGFDPRGTVRGVEVTRVYGRADRQRRDARGGGLSVVLQMTVRDGKGR